MAFIPSSVFIRTPFRFSYSCGRGICVSRLLGLLIFYALTALDIEAARLSIRAIDQLNGEPVMDSTLKLTYAGRSESSDASGWIVINDLEYGIYEGVLSGIGYASRRLRIELTEENPVFHEEIILVPFIHDLAALEVTTSLTDADQDAIDKRNAIAPVEQVSGDELQDVVDENLGDTLNRIAGVNVDSDGGNVSGINIRGAGPNQTRVTMDGQGLAGGGGRGTTRGAGAMSQIPKEFLSRVKVMKAPTPDLDADAIGGTIDLQTSKIARSKEIKTTISARSGYTEAGDTFNHRLSVAYAHPMSLGSPDRRFGVLIALNTNQGELLSDELRVLNYWPKRTSPETGERIPVLGKLRVSARETISDGYGLVINTDLLMNRNHTFQLKGMWSESQYTMLSDYNTFDFLRGKILSLTPVSGEFQDMRLEKQYYDQTRISSTGNLVVAGDHRIGDWRIDESIGFSIATSNSDGTQSALFRTKNIYDGTYDMTDSYRLPVVQLSQDGTVLAAEDIASPDPFRHSGYELLDDWAEDQELAMRVNLLKRWSSEDITWLFKSGLKARMRDASRDMDRYKYSAKPAFNLTEVSAPAREASVYRDLYPIGPAWSGQAMEEYFLANRDDFSSDPVDILLDSYASDYSVSESIYAAYSMFQRESKKWTVIGGIRLERTDSETDGYETITREVEGERIAEVNPVSISDTYDMFFPGLHCLYRPGSRWALRASLTRTLQRPDFRDLSPSMRVDLDTRRIRAGNPDLQPFDAKAVDLGTDFVINQYASASIGLFYKRIADFIVDVQEETEYLGEPFFTLSHPVNGSPADLIGVESYVSSQLPFLPRPFEDTSVSVNYTLTDSTAAYPGYEGVVTMLPEQVRENFNASLRWRYENLSVSLTARYRGLELEDLRLPGQDEFNAGYWSHSVSISYSLNGSLSVSVGASNLNRPDRYSYQGIPEQLTMIREGSRSYSIGLNYSFGRAPDTGSPSRGEPVKKPDPDPADS